jgi:hypothetical protein
VLRSVLQRLPLHLPLFLLLPLHLPPLVHLRQE